MKKKWKFVFGALLLLAAGFFIISQALQTPEVEVIKAAPTNIKRSFTEEGTVVPLQERTISALYTARIEKLLVEKGSQVSAGELVAILDDRELQYSLQELEARLSSLEAEQLQLEETPGPAELESYRLRIEEAEKNLQASQRNYERVKRLFEAEIAAQVEYEEARDLLSKAEDNLTQQQNALQILEESYEPPRGSREAIEAQKRALLAQMGLIRHQMNFYQLKAPISGIITGLELEEGDLAGPQTPLARLFQEGEYRVETRVLTSDIFDISVGMPVELLLEIRDGEIPFPGTVTEISPYAEKSHSPLGLEEERVIVTVDPEIPESLTIAPGYNLEVEFTTEELFEVLVVPKTALFPYQGAEALLVVEEGRARIRPVQAGFETRQEVVITEGLAEGELFLLDPQLSGVEEGAAVTYTIVKEGAL